MKETNENRDYPQISLSKSIFLHLLPGSLITILYIILIPIISVFGFPNRFAFLLSIAFALIPFELGYILYQSIKKNKSFSLDGVIYFRESLSLWKYIVYGLILLIYALSITMFLAPLIDNFILKNLFFWVPEWFILTNSFIGYAKDTLIIMAIMGLILNGFIGPIVEELYFRGYLLPRISRLNITAIILNVLFHSIYHFWMPWRIPSLVLALFPAAFVVWKKKNIKLGILIHIIGNSIGSILTLAYIISM